MLAMAGYFRLKESSYVWEISQTAIFVIIFLTYLLSIFYVLLIKYIKNPKINVYLQAIGDVLIVTAMVFYTGGIRSIYAVFYQLVIIYSVIFLGRRGGVLIASGCSILYGLLVNLQFYRLLYPVTDNIDYDINNTVGYVFFRTLIYILSFYIIAFLASFVVEREKKARELLEEKETAFDQLDLLHRSILQSIDAGILTVNLQNNIKSFNRAAEVITGYSAADMFNRNIEDVFKGYTKIIERVNGIAQNDAKVITKRSEITITAKNGNSLALGCSISPLNDHLGRRIGDILIFQDLSSIKMMEQALEKNRRLAFVGEMAASLAHEMRNPMASISGSIQLLKRDLQLSDADERLMQIILRGKDQLENFIKDFLLMARPAAGARANCDVASIIEDVIEAICYVPEWDERHFIQKDIANPLSFVANKAEMRQILWNLVLNAVQAMPEGGTIRVSANKVQLNTTDHCLEIKIADAGGGITEDDRSKVFEPFFTTKEKGTGLGLAIVNRIVESYGGKIIIESEDGKGAAFIVTLPANS